MTWRRLSLWLLLVGSSTCSGPAWGQAAVRRVERVDGQWQPVGALSGKTVYLSPGHGLAVKGRSKEWAIQGGFQHEIAEDLSNLDGVAEFLVPELLAAGAHVVPLREIDPNPEMVIVDDRERDGDRGRYREEGPAELFATAAGGWSHPRLPLRGEQNPFAGGESRLMRTTSEPSARAIYVAEVPADGRYYVYISYTSDEGRAADVPVTVRHPGGETHYLVDQRRHGRTWVLLGRFFFRAGQDAERGAVIVGNASAEAGGTVSLDAVRLGGGSGLIDRGSGTSGRPRAEEACRYHVQFSGAPPEVYDAADEHTDPDSGDTSDRVDDRIARPRFAGWLHDGRLAGAPAEQAAFLSVHNDGYKGKARGSWSYCYAPEEADDPREPRDLRRASCALRDAVHEAVIHGIHRRYDPSWRDRGVRQQDLAELNLLHQAVIPGALLEVAFHSDKGDARALKDSAFRAIWARGVYAGLVRFFVERDDAPVILTPASPTQLRAVNRGQGRVVVSWQPPPDRADADPPESYRVQLGRDGYAFDQGVDSEGRTSVELEALPPGEVVYLRVVGRNAGGDSLPTPTLAVGVSHGAEAPLLLVDGFQRRDGEIAPRDPHHEVVRLWRDKVNDGSYLALYGAALAGMGVAFDAAVARAVAEGEVSLVDYRAVIWQAGKGTTADAALSEAAEEALSEAAEQGVALLISGTSVGRQLARAKGSWAGIGETLPVENQRRVTAARQGPLRGLPRLRLSSGEAFGQYDVQAPEALLVDGEALPLALYADAQVAAVQQRDDERCTMVLGFPWETIVGADQRAEVLYRLLRACGIDAARGGGGKADDAETVWDFPGCGLTPTRAWPFPQWLLLLLLLLALRGRRGRRHAAISWGRRGTWQRCR
jgi:N-acetylmuramoyl-L-alanine amidase